MKETISAREAVRRLQCATNAKDRVLDEPSQEFNFAVASVHLGSLITLATTCDLAREDEKNTPEVSDILVGLSHCLRVIAYSLDDTLEQIALHDDVRWISIRGLEDEIKKSVE